MFRQAAQVALLFPEIFEIARGAEIFALADDPPERIAGDVVHRRGQGGVVADEVETAGENFVASVRGDHALEFRIEVAHPDQPVAFDAVEEVVPHAEPDGAPGGFPDLVEPRITALEGAALVDGIFQRKRENVLQFELFNRVDSQEAESGRAVFERTERGQQQFGVMDGVGLIRTAHRLGRGFAEPQATAPAGAGDDGGAAGKFGSEIQQQGASGRKQGVVFPVEGTLTLFVVEKAASVAVGAPDNPADRQIGFPAGK